MQKFLILFTLVAALLCISLVGAAQPPTDLEFVTGPGRFGITIAAKPTEQKDSRFDLAKFSFNGTTYTWKDSDGPILIIEYYDVSPETGLFLPPASRTKVVDAFKASLVPQLKNAGIETTESRFPFQGFNGVEIRGTNRSLIAQLFFANGRFYALQAAASDRSRFLDKVATLKTFRPLPKDEYVALRIAESSPKPLPHDSRRGRPLSDAAASDLKGQVASVNTEVQEGSSPRERSSDEYYDQFGDLLKEVNYIRGYPDNITSWGWIDGKRVSIWTHIEYGLADGPNEKGIVTLVGMAEADPPGKPPRDPRFTNRYEYKYDQTGKLIERLEFQNNGDLWQPIVYSYRPGIRESAFYDEKRKLTHRVVDKLNTSGNVVEHSFYDGAKLDSIEVYKHEFDSRGNWIVRKTFRKSLKTRKTALKPSSVEYRKITYLD